MRNRSLFLCILGTTSVWYDDDDDDDNDDVYLFISDNNVQRNDEKHLKARTMQLSQLLSAQQYTWNSGPLSSAAADPLGETSMTVEPSLLLHRRLIV